MPAGLSSLMFYLSPKLGNSTMKNIVDNIIIIIKAPLAHHGGA